MWNNWNNDRYVNAENNIIFLKYQHFKQQKKHNIGDVNIVINLIIC